MSLTLKAWFLNLLDCSAPLGLHLRPLAVAS